MHARKIKSTKSGKHRFKLFDITDEQGDHQPNCSSVTDEELAESIEGVWPNSNGNAIVDYSFTYPAFWWLTDESLSRYRPQSIDDNTISVFQNKVNTVLANFTAAYQGIFTLNQISKSFKTDFSPFTRGIFYVQAATEAEFIKDDQGAFTYARYDNNGYLKKAIVYLPTDLSIYDEDLGVWVPGWTESAITQETAHSLGGGNLQNFPGILDKLRNIPDGVFCAELDFPDTIFTNISSCMQNCTPNYAIYPGPLDIRSMQLAYIDGNYGGTSKNRDYLLNAFELAIFFIMITGAYSAVDNVASSIRFRKNGRTIPFVYTQTFLNIATLIMFIFLDAPDYVPIVFAITAALKLLPEGIFNSVPSLKENAKLKFILDSHYPLYMLAFVSSIAEGTKVGPLFLTWAMSLLGTLTGDLVGYGSSFLISPLINLCLDKSVNLCFPADDAPVHWLPTGTDGNEVELADRGQREQPNAAEPSDASQGLPQNEINLADYERGPQQPTKALTGQQGLASITEAKDEADTGNPMDHEEKKQPSHYMQNARISPMFFQQQQALAQAAYQYDEADQSSPANVFGEDGDNYMPSPARSA
jgi:hypothetical protein